MAVTLDAAALLAAVFPRGAPSYATSEAARYLAVVSARVDRYAPDAPADIANEAAIRFAAYLMQSDAGAIESETLGPKTTQYVTNHADIFRRCGAAGLLSPWKVRRAGLIG